MKAFIIAFICLLSLTGLPQTKPGTTFSGSNGKDLEVCAASAGNFVSEKQVEYMITDMLAKVGARNRYIIVNCTQVENCQAFLFRGKPYILYNPNFLGQVKKLNFSSAALPDATDKDWETLTILAHELGHHINNHLLNPLPDATQIDMELEADETAGFIIYLLGGTLQQAQLAYNSLSEKSSYTHPGRSKRLEAVEKGWNDAEQKYPRSVVVNNIPDKPISPGINNDVNTVNDKDGNIYKTVKIGQQVWMQSNLDVSKFRDGKAILEVASIEELQNATQNKTPAFCYYQFDSGNEKKFGKLYNRYAIRDKQNLAPPGWHIPTESEWKDLMDYARETEGVSFGNKLKSSNGWVQGSNGIDQYGFKALPSGDLFSNISPQVQFSEQGKNACWATSSLTLSQNKEYMRVAYIQGIRGDFLFGALNEFGFVSVRCIKD